MFLQAHLWAVSLLWALITGVIIGLSTFISYRGDSDKSKRIGDVITVFILTFGIDLFVTYIGSYLFTPALVGALGGVVSLIIFSVIASVIAIAINAIFHRDGVMVPIVVIVVSILTLIIEPGVQHFIYGTGLNQARYFASLANVKTVEDAQLPPTDPDHLVMVPQQVAIYKGTSVIGTTGDNLGSIFQTNSDDYTLQSIANHLYWIAPLDYSSMWNQVGFFATKYDSSPGFVAVDAENPDAPAILHLKDEQGKLYAIKYLPDAAFGQNLERHIYLAGYTDGMIENATLEVDDHWRPFYTVTYLKPAAGGVSGQIIDSVLLVDAQTGEITRYAPDKVPAWVDRVMSRDLVKQYAQDWGKYSDYRHTRYWFDNTQFQSQASDIELHYQVGGNPIWVMPFTSSNGNDASSLGVMVVDTHDNKWTFYKGFAGKPVGQPVEGAFTSFPNSPVKINNLAIESTQLYSIYGHPTWVAIYARSVGVGSAFAGIAFLDALDPQPANVVFGERRDAALANYRSYLAGDHQMGSVARDGEKSTPKEGVVARIGASLVNGQWTYTITIAGDKHIYQIGGNSSPDLSIVHPGDQIAFSYLDTGERVQAIGNFQLKSDPAATK
ncbi:MAG TPA: hypothetical protein V6C81_11850 [Planktothrix sp.]|jgi:hypothetical protein